VKVQLLDDKEKKEEKDTPAVDAEED